MRKTKPVFTSVFADSLEKFLAHKRAIGYKYASEAAGLANFDRWCEIHELRETDLESEIISNWQKPRNAESAKSHANRSILLAQFAKFMHGIGEGAYLPPTPVKLPKSTFVPHIFAQSELTAIFAAVDAVQNNNCSSHVKEIYPMMFRLLYGCGLRVSEVSSLKKTDVDMESGILRIMDSKCEVDRLVPLSEPLCLRLRDYMSKMAFLVPNTLFVFPNRSGGSMAEVSIYARFREFLCVAKIPHKGRGNGPRLHDFRHTFAVHSLQKMADEGLDLYCALPILAAYLGHGNISSTERYLRLTNEMHGRLLAQVREKHGDIVPYAKTEVRIEY